MKSELLSVHNEAEKQQLHYQLKDEEGKVHSSCHFFVYYMSVRCLKKGSALKICTCFVTSEYNKHSSKCFHFLVQIYHKRLKSVPFSITTAWLEQSLPKSLPLPAFLLVFFEKTDALDMPRLCAVYGQTAHINEDIVVPTSKYIIPVYNHPQSLLLQ